MFPSTFFTHYLIIGLGAAALLVIIKAVAYGTKLFPLPTKTTTNFQTAGIASIQAKQWTREDLLPPLIDKPADHPSEQAGIYEIPQNDPISFDLFEEESGTTLLKEAEQVVEQIQEAVNEAVSNPDEVLPKIGAIVSQYRLFLDTEYYDAINGFIAVTVQRDCDINVTEEQLHSLWIQQAA